MERAVVPGHCALMGATRLEAAEKCPDAGQGKLL